MRLNINISTGNRSWFTQLIERSFHLNRGNENEIVKAWRLFKIVGILISFMFNQSEQLQSLKQQEPLKRIDAPLTSNWIECQSLKRSSRKSLLMMQGLMLWQRVTRQDFLSKLRKRAESLLVSCENKNNWKMFNDVEAAKDLNSILCRWEASCRLLDTFVPKWSCSEKLCYK